MIGHVLGIRGKLKAKTHEPSEPHSHHPLPTVGPTDVHLLLPWLWWMRALFYAIGAAVIAIIAIAIDGNERVVPPRRMLRRTSDPTVHAA
jgi:hypothetical protein